MSSQYIEGQGVGPRNSKFIQTRWWSSVPKNNLTEVTIYEKVGIKLNIQKTKIMASGPISSRQMDGETEERVNREYW